MKAEDLVMEITIAVELQMGVARAMEQQTWKERKRERIETVDLEEVLMTS